MRTVPGTTTFSDVDAYSKIGLNGELVDFIFEKAAVPKVRYAQNWTIQQEISHIQNVYGPFIIQHAKELQQSLKLNSVESYTIADLSHSSLFHYRGLINLAKQYPDQLSLHFIRIRRDRVETIISITSDMKYWEHDYYRYHPCENVPAVILKVNPQVWASFNRYVMALWFLDEVEARWNRMLAYNPQMPTTEVLWGSRWSNSVNESLTEIANVIGTRRLNATSPAKNEHAHKRRKEDVALHMYIIEMDRMYQRAMGYGYVPA